MCLPFVVKESPRPIDSRSFWTDPWRWWSRSSNASWRRSKSGRSEDFNNRHSWLIANLRVTGIWKNLPSSSFYFLVSISISVSHFKKPIKARPSIKLVAWRTSYRTGCKPSFDWVPPWITGRLYITEGRSIDVVCDTIGVREYIGGGGELAMVQKKEMVLGILGSRETVHLMFSQFTLRRSTQTY